MMKRNAFFRDPKHLNEVYLPLSRWTDWWFANRDTDGDGIPEYQNGNDSGWDNATPFSLGVPLESPDLAAYLVVQMDVLADVASRIGRPADARRWRARADRLFAQMMQTQWRGDRFVASLAGSDRTTEADSLLLWVPMILGERLAPDVRRALVTGVQRRFVTDHGVATESPKSPRYEGDGYWRGPVWGPSTLLVVDGLVACGARDVAMQVARGYTTSLQGSSMPENFDALTGQARKDTGFSWTAAAFLLLAHELEATAAMVR
jgi:glycogen debranching enzyme